MINQDDKFFTLKELHNRIKAFDFGYFEKNKPRPIIQELAKQKKNEKMRSEIKLEQSAAESLCLARYLSVIIGDLVPESNKFWQLYMYLREILAVVMAPSFQLSDITRLRYLIHQLNSMYIELFGFLKPKMHFLVPLLTFYSRMDQQSISGVWEVNGKIER